MNTNLTKPICALLTAALALAALGCKPTAETDRSAVEIITAGTQHTSYTEPARQPALPDVSPVPPMKSSDAAMNSILEDAEITRQIREKFDKDPELQAANILVSTKDYVVLLEGIVRKPETSMRAQQIAEETPKVLSVINRLQVMPIAISPAD